jgi:hypothetical protein
MQHIDSDALGIPRSSRDLPFDLDLATFLNFDPNPTFILEVSPCEPLPFDILFSNDAIRKDPELEAEIWRDDSSARIFRGWAQTTTHWRQPYDFAGRSWTAFLIAGKWKGVRALASMPAVVVPDKAVEDTKEVFKRADIGVARLESILHIMEMSDVACFEVDTHGSLIWANVKKFPFFHLNQRNTNS